MFNRVRGIKERENETRGCDIHERDRETRIRDYHERDAGDVSDRRNQDYHATYNPREQRDRAYHTSRHDRDREADSNNFIITLFESQIILAEHECRTNWGDCKSQLPTQLLVSALLHIEQ